MSPTKRCTNFQDKDFGATARKRCAIYVMPRQVATWTHEPEQVASRPVSRAPAETRSLATPVRGRAPETATPVLSRTKTTPSLITQAFVLSVMFGAVAPEAVVGDAKDRPWMELRGSSAEGGRVSVYVYDDPALDQTDLIQCYRDQHDGVPPWQDERADMAQDMGEIWLHQSLLVHEWRVLDPEDADVFFVPLYPVLSAKLLGISDKKCGGRTHKERIKAAIIHLDHESTYFKRFGGADHVMICAWWDCRNALTRTHRMLMRRAVIGVNERIKEWVNWGCSGKMVTVPYTASSVVTADRMIGGKGSGERHIPFFFAGTSRSRPERKNLEVRTVLL